MRKKPLVSLAENQVTFPLFTSGQINNTDIWSNLNWSDPKSKWKILSSCNEFHENDYLLLWGFCFWPSNFISPWHCYFQQKNWKLLTFIAIVKKFPGTSDEDIQIVCNKTYKMFFCFREPEDLSSLRENTDINQTILSTQASTYWCWTHSCFSINNTVLKVTSCTNYLFILQTYSLCCVPNVSSHLLQGVCISC